uniref:type II toxin-antitoxin system PemK/MazF family toxin n=1 Tax=Candidatus Magnetaquicoccus inordinatus TaxID=2496818 RepID=UPI00102D218B
MIAQYDVVLVCLDPTVGKEIQKTRPCVVLTPKEMNVYSYTIIVAPMTTKEHLNIPTRIGTVFKSVDSWIALDQIRTIDKQRIVKKLGKINKNCYGKIKNTLSEM